MLSNKEKKIISLIILLLILQIIGYLSVFVLLFLPMTDAILSVQNSQFEIPNYVYPLVSSIVILWSIADFILTMIIFKAKWTNQNLIAKIRDFEKKWRGNPRRLQDYSLVLILFTQIWKRLFEQYKIDQEYN